MRNRLFMIVKHFKPSLLVLFVALVGAQASGASGLGAPQTAPARKAELETAAAAKRALAEIGERDFGRARDAKLRTASLRALAALKAVANNRSKAREAALVAQLDRAVAAAKAQPQPEAMGLQECDNGYASCMEQCKLTGGDCKLCGIEQNGCYLLKLAIAIAQQNDPSKN